MDKALKLKQIRKELRLNQTEMADELGIRQSYYSALERGEKQITTKITTVLFNKLNVSPNWFYNATGNIFTPTSDEELAKRSAELSGESKAIHEIYRVMGRIYDPALQFEELREKMLNEAQEMEDKTLYFYLRTMKEIPDERPELTSLLKNLGEVMVEVDLLERALSHYIGKPLDRDLSASDYEDFKSKRIAHLESFEKYRPILPKLLKHLVSAKQLLAAFDADRIMNIYGSDKDKGL